MYNFDGAGRYMDSFLEFVQFFPVHIFNGTFV